jgi:hypothetical protein
MAGCGNNPGNPNNGSSVVLRQSIGVNLAQVRSFVSIGSTTSQSTALRAAYFEAAFSSNQSDEGVASDCGQGGDGGQGGDCGQGGGLFALTLSGGVEPVPIVESADPNVQVPAANQPNITAIFPTASWILFEAPGFQTGKKVETDGGAPRWDPVMCSMIAVRRADGALFCAPLYTNRDWSGRDLQTTILANAAGDVVYAMLNVADVPAQPPSGDAVLYRIVLGGDSGPTATPAINFPVFMLHSFRANGAGDLYLSYIATAMSGTMQTKILPLNGSSAFTVQGSANCAAIAGEPGRADEDTFYAVNGGCSGQSVDGLIRVITKSGPSFTESDQALSFPGGSQYSGLYRLADGIYMFSAADKALLRVIADGAILTTLAPTPLTGVTRVLGLDSTSTIYPHGGYWVFIAETASGYEFVRHNGITQQDIPFDSTLDIRSFTVSSDGAIDFLAVRTDTQEKVRGTIAFGSTEVTVESAGALDPARVVAFTQVN